MRIRKLIARIGRRQPSRPQPRLFFLHVPKTGGTSVWHALQGRYEPANRLHVRSDTASGTIAELYRIGPTGREFDRQRQALVLAVASYFAHQGVPLLGGHIRFESAVAAFKTIGYQLLTTLRDPIDRWYSNYFYSRHQQEDKHYKIDVELEEFLDSESAREFGAMYIRFFSGLGTDHRYDTSTAIAAAKKNIAEFDIVGFLDDLPAFAREVSRRHGLNLNIKHKQKNPVDLNEAARAQAKRYKESPEIRKLVTKLCAPDIELYEHACSIFRKRLADAV
jgi:hypothetical protein